MKALSVTILPNATVSLAFGSPEDRDAARALVAANVPREVHSRFRSGESGGQSLLTIRVQDISEPLAISLTGDSAAPATPANIPTGTPTFERLKTLPRDSVPGANADAHTEERPTTSGVNLTQGVPGAVNNDPSTATNAGFEGSPAQALQSLGGEGLGAGATPTPGGFAGPDKAARVEGAVGGSPIPGPTAESLHPEGQTPDAGAVNVSKAAAEEAAAGEPGKREVAAAAGFTGGVQDARASDGINSANAEVAGASGGAAAGSTDTGAGTGAGDEAGNGGEETAEELEANHTKDELTALAEKSGVEVKSAMTKADLAAAIVDARD